METKNKTIGEKRIGTLLNLTENDTLTKIKNKTTQIIDDLQALKNDEYSKTYEKSQEDMMSLSGEKLRLINLAQTKYEEAYMWTEKAFKY